ncbi:MAG: 30S ribosomal protein S17 [Fimbriimonadaceae bacterium]|nr:30S ribosomal protein S17 [Fimbriimonadaceae bacterium]
MPEATEKKSTKKAAPKAAKTKAPKEAVEAGSQDRGRRKLRQGVVSSNRMSKTVVVKVERRVQHPLYGKVVKRTEKFKAHDEVGCDIGDTVEIMETRPISREKRWRVTRIIEKVR